MVTGNGLASGWRRLNRPICLREGASACSFSTPGMCRAWKMKLNFSMVASKALTRDMMWGFEEEELLRIETRAMLSVRNSTALLDSRWPQR